MKKIAICGHFGNGFIYLDGQTVKTKNLSECLNKYSDFGITEVDTHGWTKHPFRLYKKLKHAFKECDAVIMLPANRGIKVFTPLFVRLRKKYNKKIYYDVVGGWLPDFVENKPKLAKKLKGFDGIWVETSIMQERLAQLEFNNVSVVPNFKDLTPLKEEELNTSYEQPFRLCTFSRVSYSKGIEDAIGAVKAVNQNVGKTVYQLDIYGQVSSADSEWFESLKNEFPDYIKYCGAIDSSRSVEVIKDYFALLFPTFYQGEGFAGTLIDAMMAGLPAIASDWKYNSEVLQDKKTGLLHVAKDVNSLIEKLEFAMNNAQEFVSMKKNCIEEAKKYIAENVVKRIAEFLENDV